MRFFSLLFLLLFAGIIALFAFQNQYDVTLKFWDWEVTTSLPLLAGVIFVAGMLGGWSILGALRTSVHRVVDQPRRESYR